MNIWNDILLILAAVTGLEMVLLSFPSVWVWIQAGKTKRDRR